MVMMYIRRCSAIQGAVRPFMIVKLKVLIQSCIEFWNTLVIVEIDVFVLHTTS